MWSLRKRSTLDHFSAHMRYNAARERCQCDGRRCAAKTTPTCVFSACLRGLLFESPRIVWPIFQDTLRMSL
jgi:hypothetical protein